MEPGKAFGELALDPSGNGRRRASILVAPFDEENNFEFCELMYIDKETYNRCVGSNVDDDTSSVTKRLELLEVGRLSPFVPFSHILASARIPFHFPPFCFRKCIYLRVGRVLRCSPLRTT